MGEAPERRRENRLALALPVLIEYNGRMYYCILRNLSPSGAFIETDRHFPLGSFITVTFEFYGSGASIVAESEVKHSVRFAYTSGAGESKTLRGIGVKFSQFLVGEDAPYSSRVPC